MSQCKTGEGVPSVFQPLRPRNFHLPWPSSLCLDTGSDFAFAKVSGLKSSDLSRFVQAETENNFISTLTYLIISLPGIFIAFTGVVIECPNVGIIE